MRVAKLSRTLTLAAAIFGYAGGAADAMPTQVRMADIAIVFDESGSNSASVFNAQKNIAIDIVENFNIGPDDIRFSVSAYAHNARIVSHMTDNEQHTLDAINNTNQTGGNGCLACGIDTAMYQLMLAAFSRPDPVSQFIILFSDGENTLFNGQGAWQIAQEARDRGITILGVVTGGFGPMRFPRDVVSDLSGQGVPSLFELSSASQGLVGTLDILVPLVDIGPPPVAMNTPGQVALLVSGLFVLAIGRRRPAR